MTIRKRCFLEQDIWKTVPWALDPESKTTAQYLHDIFCDMPGMLEDINTLGRLASSEDRSRLYMDLCEKTTSRLVQLYKWRWRWHVEFSGSCWEVAASSSNTIGVDKNSPSPFSSILYFDSIRLASDITNYDAILLVLLWLHRVLRLPFSPEVMLATQDPLLFESSESNSPLLLPGRATGAEDVGREICRAVDYHLLENRHRAGAFYLFFPLRMAYFCFDANADEAIWIRRVLVTVSETGGWEIGRNMLQSLPSMPRDLDNDVFRNLNYSLRKSAKQKSTRFM